MLIVCLSSRISPCTSTVILRDRSPLRDCRRHVRDVSNLTREVRRHRVHVVRQILPRSRDARHVRLTAKLSFGSYFLRHARYFVGERAESWSTIVLIVLLSSSVSPRASTVIFRDRSPFATAVVTSAMFRT